MYINTYYLYLYSWHRHDTPQNKILQPRSSLTFHLVWHFLIPGASIFVSLFSLRFIKNIPSQSDCVRPAPRDIPPKTRSTPEPTLVVDLVSVRSGASRHLTLAVTSHVWWVLSHWVLSQRWQSRSLHRETPSLPACTCVLVQRLQLYDKYCGCFLQNFNQTELCSVVFLLPRSEL